jgi:positive regulator of sigma E activity
MTIRGIVKEMKGEAVVIEACREEDCAVCGGCSGKEPKASMISAANPRNFPLAAGDEVVVYLSPWKAIKAGFTVLIFPLVLFLLLFLIAGRWLGISSEGVKVLFGLAGLAGGFALSYLLKRRKGRTDLPEIAEHKRERGGVGV